MRVIGIDIGSETHVVAVVDAAGQTVLKPTSITEDATGYARLLELLGDPSDALVVMRPAITGRTFSPRWRRAATPSPW